MKIESVEENAKMAEEGVKEKEKQARKDTSNKF